jgi:hypothetical protein
MPYGEPDTGWCENVEIPQIVDSPSEPRLIDPLNLDIKSLAMYAS